MPVEALQCKECHETYPLDARYVCDRCFGPLEVAYDHSRLKQDVGADFVRQEKIIGAALVPHRVDADGVRDHDHAFGLRRAAAAEHLIEDVRIGRVNGHDDVRLEPREQSAQITFQRKKNPEISDEIRLAIQPAIDDAPDARGPIDHPHVESANPIIHDAVGVGEEVVELDVNVVRRDFAQAVADATGGAIMSFAVAGREDQNIFQDSLGVGGTLTL